MIMNNKPNKYSTVKHFFISIPMVLLLCLATFYLLDSIIFHEPFEWQEKLIQSIVISIMVSVFTYLGRFYWKK